MTPPLLTDVAPPLGVAVPHDSAALHVTGRGMFLDDLPPVRGELLVGFVGSSLARGRITALHLDAARAVPGVAAVLTAADIPGSNAVGPVFHDEQVLAWPEVRHVGQPVVCIAAETPAALAAARAKVRIDCEVLPAILEIEDAIAAGAFIGPERRIERGDVRGAMAAAPHVFRGTFRIGGQEHFYLESHSAIAEPHDDGSLTVHSSTQNPAEVQTLVAEALGLGQHQVVCVCRRMGGGFGGKETQAAGPALLAALVAHHTRRPARIVLDRDTDMASTGKRHPYLVTWEAGFDGAGTLLAYAADFHSDGGFSADLSLAVMERTLLHAENACFIPHFRVTGRVCRTDKPSNTAFRGFGGPQGVAAIERVLEHAAVALGLDPVEVRRRNLYGGPGRDTTPYGQVFTGNRLAEQFDRLAVTADLAARRETIRRFNAGSRSRLRGLGVTPVKFGISFTRRTLNQAAAVVAVFRDGTVQVSTGGTEMGQGLNTKVAQLVAARCGLPLDMVRVLPTSTDRINNASPTAASAGTDLNGTAAVRAAEGVLTRLTEVAAALFHDAADGFHGDPACVDFREGAAFDRRDPANKRIPWRRLVAAAYERRVDLGARGFYATPGVDYNRETGRGRPFLYYTTGVAATEVEIDRFTGALRVTRVDLIMDIGRPINPGVDAGQVIGGFVQGMGWVTGEQLVWSAKGDLLSHSPTTYKIPAAGDVPADFRVEFLPGAEPSNVAGSKAVGEPPLLLGMSAWAAVHGALAAGLGRVPELDLPATHEAILRALHSGASQAVKEPRTH